MQEISRLLCLLLLIAGCTTRQNTTPKSEASHPVEALNCNFKMENMEQEHLAMAIRSDTIFSNCLKNYLKFEQIEETSFQFCTQVRVTKDGVVRSVSLINGNLPKSLHWCIEQEIWSKNFRGLLLNRTTTVTFPVKLLVKTSEK